MKYLFWFSDMFCMKRVSRDQKATVHWSEAKRKSASRPAYKPRINRGRTPKGFKDV